MNDAIAQRARDLAQHCEAKKHAYRQTQDGVVVSFVLHPHEVPAALTLAPLGTRYMLALVEIGDDEQPKGGDPHAGRGTMVETGMARSTDETPPAPVAAQPGRAKVPFNQMSPAQQAGILCADVKFQRFMYETHGSAMSEEHAKDAVRELCAVTSRSLIQPGSPAAAAWREIVIDFRAWEHHPEFA